MKAYKIEVQVHCGPREFNGNKHNGLWRCCRHWPVGTTKATLTVVRGRDLPKVSDDQRPAQLDELHAQGAVLDTEYQGLVDEVSLSMLVLRHETATFDFKPPKEMAPRKLAIDELEEEDATKPTSQQSQQQPKR